jgi:F-box/leucine-rich repeat protein 7
MYWLVRGVVAVTSRDGEAVYAELKPGAFFGEIGVLMKMPRTATIIARTRCLLVVLKKEDLHAELPKFPDMERTILQEAQERLAILKKKQQEKGMRSSAKSGAVSREVVPGGVTTGDAGVIKEGTVVNSKKRKSPSPGVIEDPSVGGSALASGYFNVRTTLKELPLFSELPTDVLHFLGLSAQPVSYPPFTDIVRQGCPGNEIFFIVRGEAEVIRESPHEKNIRRLTRSSMVRPRLKAGQYFGEVASLGLASSRTATVRSVTSVECLMVGGEALGELWRKCPPEIRSQVEETARKRYQKDDDVEMKDTDEKELSDSEVDPLTPNKRTLPQVTFTTSSKHGPPIADEPPDPISMHTDPDPYLSVDIENMRSRRRSSIAPPTPAQSDSSSPPANGITNGARLSQTHESSPLKLYSMSAPNTPPENNDDQPPSCKRQRTLPTRPATYQNMQKPVLPDDILVMVFNHLDIVKLLRLRVVCSHWRRLLTTSDKLCKEVDLSSFNRYVTDWALANVLGPFIGSRPEIVDISNCYHVTDEGFNVFWKHCGKNIKSWRMRSVWDVSAGQILEMSENAKQLEEVDWSNCRKVGDNLLARVVGWVVPDPPPERKAVVISSSGAPSKSRTMRMHSMWQQAQQQPHPNAPPPGTVIGCPKLKHLNLSYCKHITDRSMAHLAAHASSRLESLALTRCTSITDAGFQSWAPFRFPNLTRLCLADCTYLSDNAIVALVNSAKQLTHLDLSFCCALSDTATEVVALGLPLLRELRLAFCGSAVSDASLGCIALHLNELRGLSVRGCVRVTGVGIENVLEGCGRIEWVDVSQCKNLGAWLAGGGVTRWGYDERGPGRWLPMSVTRGVTGQRTVDPALLMNNNMNVPRPQTPVNGGSANGNGPGLAPSPFGSPGGGMSLGMAYGGGVGGPGPMMKPVVPPRGMRNRRQRKPIRCIVEKGAGGLR